MVEQVTLRERPLQKTGVELMMLLLLLLLLLLQVCDVLLLLAAALHLLVDEMVLGIDLLGQLVEYDVRIVDGAAYDVYDADVMLLGEEDGVGGRQAAAHYEQRVFLQARQVVAYLVLELAYRAQLVAQVLALDAQLVVQVGGAVGQHQVLAEEAELHEVALVRQRARLASVALVDDARHLPQVLRARH